MHSTSNTGGSSPWSPVRLLASRASYYTAEAIEDSSAAIFETIGTDSLCTRGVVNPYLDKALGLYVATPDFFDQCQERGEAHDRRLRQLLFWDSALLERKKGLERAYFLSRNCHMPKNASPIITQSVSVLRSGRQIFVPRSGRFGTSSSRRARSRA